MYRNYLIQRLNAKCHNYLTMIAERTMTLKKVLICTLPFVNVSGVGDRILWYSLSPLADLAVCHTVLAIRTAKFHKLLAHSH